MAIEVADAREARPRTSRLMMFIAGCPGVHSGLLAKSVEERSVRGGREREEARNHKGAGCGFGA